MTAVLPTTSAPATASSVSAPSTWALLRLPLRLVRRGALLLWLGAAVYMAMEVVVYRETYPTAESLEQLRRLSSSSAVRMMQGDPGSVDTIGGFAVWDAGWMLFIIVASWALLTVTRLTRGEEDAGRADVVLSRPLTAQAQQRAALTTMLLCSLGLGVAAAVPFLLLGEGLAGTLIWGTGVAAFTMLMSSLGALVAQLVEPRRRAVSVGFALLVAAYLVRVVANSAEEREWLLTLTPFGWADRLHVFAENSWGWLLVPAAAALLLSVVAVGLAARRDTGAAVLKDRAKRRSNSRMLGSAPAFGWRLGQGALVAWGVILGVMSVVFGVMTDALLELLEEDDGYRKTLEAMGVDLSEPLVGFLSYLAVSIAVTVAAFTGFRLGTLRQEEAEGRLDNLLVRGAVRWQWLALSTLLAVLAAGLLLVVSALGTWLGARLVDAPLPLDQVVEPMAGTLPLVLFFVGLSVLTFGLAPRQTTVLPVTVAVVTYLLDTIGTALEWPSWVLGLSPFHHLARLPGDPMTAGATAGMTAAGLLLVVLGVVAFSRRDLRGP